ncbi:undecaprenyldiphospho-muramoylpentapeptide beta-N-acetylglucosaminyltransferase [Rhodoblastus sp.]|uniref:undecaprenyldiphospho-muramoylpentapeptide beta-N-acetylglucosaminyltransferase n=1 Tax=Rhodoblastus sp. TaxID=1962975 RepID=UPI002627F2F1|nr:undecaprenyldiphospho-muramoylpentapeptide beta-N-acetylglucosaminyltransferase [Rhodoblastus sp.]
MSREETKGDLVLVAAGGTGGHLFPAQALAQAIRARGIRVQLATDERALRYGGDFPAEEIHEIASATPTSRGLGAKISAALVLGKGVVEAYRLLGAIKPRVVVSFGGYPTVPPALAASLRAVPLILHEQNAVMGRANRFLARRADRIACGFPTLEGLPESLCDRVVQVGNPVRPAVLEAARLSYPGFDDGRLRLLVTGGSQGARIMSDVVPAAIERLALEQRARLVIVQQARGEDLARVREVYLRLGVNFEAAAFFPDLPLRMAKAHLVLARSGASTVSELAVVGRPSILVPFPHALDADQAANARHLEKAGAAEVMRQTGFTPEWLAERLARALDEPRDLTRRAQAAKSAGVPDAAERLADLALKTAGL